jgi:hypothetical protein
MAKKNVRTKTERQAAAHMSLPKALRAAESDADALARHRYQHREWPMVAMRQLCDRVTKATRQKPVSLQAAIQADALTERKHAKYHVAALNQLWNGLLKGRPGRRPPKALPLSKWSKWPKVRKTSLVASRLPAREKWLPARDRLLVRLGIEERESIRARLLADFKRAVIDGDANWFKRQLKAIKGVGFERAPVRGFDVALKIESMHAPPGMTDQDVLDRLEQRKDGRCLIVEGRTFRPSAGHSAKFRCLEAIRRFFKREDKPLVKSR